MTRKRVTILAGGAALMLAGCASTPTTAPPPGPVTTAPARVVAAVPAGMISTGATGYAQATPGAIVAMPLPAPAAVSGPGAASVAAQPLVETFGALCAAHLDDPAAIANAARARGFGPSALSGSGLLGPTAYIAENPALDQSVQVNVTTPHGFECAVTGADVAAPELLRQAFFAAQGLTGAGTTAQKVVNGKRYIFVFNTNGGEALVVYRD
ncbi:hypothetical protein [Rhodobacter maris]|uniref:Lipoprotein n=1 Tax=Rhodobacter maris TaxID=446682 RepID=A0A285RJJ9_9RHOB|nr:hypothetical protein [Rhodobacter maris]SOB94306.1 hypothetical protein SAMN05877831_101384 [Rhodobacter maris]